jgi:hypothetical protein
MLYRENYQLKSQIQKLKDELNKVRNNSLESLHKNGDRTGMFINFSYIFMLNFKKRYL